MKEENLLENRQICSLNKPVDYFIDAIHLTQKIAVSIKLPLKAYNM